VLAAPTPALALFKVEPPVLTTLRTPPYERKDEALIQYSYCESVESGFPNTLIKSCSVAISIG